MIANAISPKRFPLYPALVGFLILIVCAAVFLGARVAAQRSNYESFKQIKLRMSKQQMEDILRSKAVSNNCVMRFAGTTEVCEYSDYLRSYWIMVDGKTNQVRRKGFDFRVPRWSNFQ